MESLHPSAPCSHRLADHLRVLSEVAETLTYRLVELEERLAAQENQLQRLLQDQDSVIGEEIDDRLADTEERLARIEALLRGVERPSSTRHLTQVKPPALQQEAIAPNGAREAMAEAEPFLEDEGEQPFMDELIA
jgi:uncharacterized coiled-coil protein SlyX